MATTHFSGPVASTNGFSTTAVLTADLPAAADNVGRIMTISDNGAGDDEFALAVSDGTDWLAITTTALT
jgi:hypothetical protein